MGNILVLGGTGAMGKPLVNILSNCDNTIYVTSRSKRKDYGNVRYIHGNAQDESFIKSILSERYWDAIVDFMVYSTDRFESRVKSLVESTKQYVFISSCRVFADKDNIITERSPRLLDVCTDKEYLQTDEYALRKAREENILRKYSNITIVRPSVTFNKDRLQLGVYEVEDWADRAIHGNTIVFSKDIASHITTMTLGDDVAVGIAGLIGNPKAFGEDFNIVTSEYYTWREIFDIYLEVLKSFRLDVKVKVIDEALNLRIKKWQYQVKYARLFDRRFDNSKILDAVPNLEFHNVKESLKKCLLEYLKNKSNCLTLSSVSILQDREAGDVASYSDFANMLSFVKYLVLRFMPYNLLVKRIEK